MFITEAYSGQSEKIFCVVRKKTFAFFEKKNTLNYSIMWSVHWPQWSHDSRSAWNWPIITDCMQHRTCLKTLVCGSYFVLGRKIIFFPTTQNFFLSTTQIIFFSTKQNFFFNDAKSIIFFKERKFCFLTTQNIFFWLARISFRSLCMYYYLWHNVQLEMINYID